MGLAPPHANQQASSSAAELAALAPPPVADVTAALSPADAFRLLERQLSQWASQAPNGQLPKNAPIAIDCGVLVLTPKLLQKMVVILRQHQCTLGMVYARLPQTQQAALGMGLMVKEAPEVETYAGVEGLNLPWQQQAQQPPYAVEEHYSAEQPSAAYPSQEVAVGTPAGESLPAQSLSDRREFTTHQAPPQRASVQAIYPLPQEDLSLAYQPLTPAENAPYTALPTEELTPQPEMPVDASSALNTHMAQPTAPPVFEAISPELVTENALPTRLVMGSLRSGRTLTSDGHLIVVGDVHGGSEIIAAGHIVVWGELRGVAHAGAWLGNAENEATKEAFHPSLGEEATIRALAIHAVQLRIGRLIARRPDRTNNHKPERTPAARGLTPGATTPEIARVVDREIRIYEALD